MQKTVKVAIPSGFEARPVAMLVQIASQYASEVHLQVNSKSVNAKSIMGMMSLGIGTGEEVTILAEGEDEKEAVESIAKFLTEESASW